MNEHVRQTKGLIVFFAILTVAFALGGLFFHVRDTLAMQGYEVVRGIAILPEGETGIETNLIEFEFGDETFRVTNPVGSVTVGRGFYVRIDIENPARIRIVEPTQNTAGLLWTIAVAPAVGAIVSLVVHCAISQKEKRRRSK
ncbi:MAG: hypothetical protein FWB98_01810 [Defluviitaleaceae bacterium]|nr:hypothetical protein [Defluviitaleaceae bacterium]